MKPTLNVSDILRYGTDVRRNVVGQYVLHRLRAECFDPSGEPIRGTQAAIAKATNFTSAHLAHVFERIRLGAPHGRGVGHDFATALAERWWKVPFAELETQARAWATAHPEDELSPPSRSAPLLRFDPRWSAALAEAKARSPEKKHAYLDRAGDAVVPDREVTWELIVRVADLLMATEA